MQLSHAITDLESAVETQLRVAGPEIAEAGAQLMAALRPAIKEAMMDVVTMAVAEVTSQLDAQAIDIKLVDGDPELVVREDESSIPTPPPPPTGVEGEDDEARITVRLPGYLKELLASEAEISGDSVNAYLVDLIRRKTRSGPTPGHRQRTTLEL